MVSIDRTVIAIQLDDPVLTHRVSQETGLLERPRVSCLPA